MKYLFSWALRFIPRKYLQLYSRLIIKLIGFFHKGKGVICPICSHEYRKFLPFGRKSRPNALCPSCLSLERHRLIWLYLTQQTSFFEEHQKVLHVAPEACLVGKFETSPNLEYITADLESPLAKVKMDIHKIPFEPDTFDVAFCNHVMEHVDDDIKAMSELCRVLKPGGWAIIQIPLFHPVPEKTFEDKTITSPREREKIFGQDDHVRLYGKDYPDRLRSVGFQVKEDGFINKFSEDEVYKFGLPAREVLYVCHKPSA